MQPIVTLTLNPAIDGACHAEKIEPIRKIRTSNEVYDPGGGGINVSRVVHALGGTTLAVYLAGGATGPVLDDLLAVAGVPRRRVPIRDHTRISHTIFELSSGLEYRFVPEGPRIEPDELDACLAALRGLDFGWLVASGSLPPGVPAGFYGAVAAVAEEKGAKFVVDTSGQALAETLARGGVELAKPSIGEFRKLLGRPLQTREEQAAAALELVRSGAVRLLAVTMGRDGAMLATADGVRWLQAPNVPTKSAVGAGDSFVAGMSFALAQGRPPEDAFAYGVAAGTAAVLRSGTGLCRREDVERLYADIRRETAAEREPAA